MLDPSQHLPSELFQLSIERNGPEGLVAAGQVSRGWRLLTTSHPRFFIPITLQLALSEPLLQIPYNRAIQILQEASNQPLPLALTLKFSDLVNSSPPKPRFDEASDLWMQVFPAISKVVPLLRRLVLDIDSSDLAIHLLWQALTGRPAPLMESFVLRGERVWAMGYTTPIAIPTRLFGEFAPRLRYLAIDRAIELPDGLIAAPALESVEHLIVFGPAVHLPPDKLTPRLQTLELRLYRWWYPKPTLHAPGSLCALSVGDPGSGMTDMDMELLMREVDPASLKMLRVEFEHNPVDDVLCQFTPNPFLAGSDKLFNMRIRNMEDDWLSHIYFHATADLFHTSYRWSPIEVRLTTDDASIERVFTTAEHHSLAAFTGTMALVQTLELGHNELIWMLKIALYLPAVHELTINLGVDWASQAQRFLSARDKCRPEGASQADTVRFPILSKTRVICTPNDETESWDSAWWNWPAFVTLLAVELGFGQMDVASRPHLVLEGFDEGEAADGFDSHVFGRISYI